MVALVVVEIEASTGASYFPGTLTTKHPDRAKTLDVMTEIGMPVRRTPRDMVYRDEA